MKDMIGVIGGMGSHATLSLFQQIVQQTPVNTDQDFMELLIHNNTKIPDRTSGILYGGPDPLPELIRSCRILEQSGVKTILLACITAHYYADEIEQFLSKARFYNLITETIDYFSKNLPHIKNVGLLASEGTIKTKIWDNALSRIGIKVISLSEMEQKEYFNNPVYKDIKTGNIDSSTAENLTIACEKLIDKGAEVVLGACSELSLVLEDTHYPFTYIDVIRLTISKLIQDR